MSADQVSARLRLAGEEVGVVSLKLHEEVSTLTRARAQVASHDEMSTGALAGQAASLEVLVAGQVARSWSLIVGQIGFRRLQGGTHRYDVELWCPFWLLTHTLNTRKFRSRSAKDMVATVLCEGGIAHR
ncbi:MAG: hypothetical protein JRI68_28155, partial [Deltaproteobacteria bacterium]|nr:hypothetical protein [Deltaproteobacteria bacterium]